MQNEGSSLVEHMLDEWQLAVFVAMGARTASEVQHRKKQVDKTGDVPQPEYVEVGRD